MWTVTGAPLATLAGHTYMVLALERLDEARLVQVCE